MFSALFLFAAIIFIGNGVFMAVSPTEHRKFLSRVLLPGNRGRLVADDRRGLEMKRRFAGLVLAGMGALFLWNIIVGGHSSQLASTRIIEESRPMVSDFSDLWFPVALGLVLVSLGVWFLARPDLLVEWSVKQRSSSRSVPERTLKKWTIGSRMLALAAIVGGLYAVASTVVRVWHR